jgi:hypothetical protein
MFGFIFILNTVLIGLRLKIKFFFVAVSMELHTKFGGREDLETIAKQRSLYSD